MSDSHPSDTRPVLREPDRESRAEALLVEGLDQYLCGHYEDAIHVWTRVLFIDRGHQRARAYIERARSALGERQRRAEEMLHRTEALIEAGSLDQARRLLSDLAHLSTDDARMASLWTSIDRAERAERRSPADVDVATEGSAMPAILPASAARRGIPIMAWVAAASVGIFLVALAASPSVRAWFGGGEPLPAVPPSLRAEPLPIPSGAEVALTRARTLYARGRLAEALDVLDRVSPSSPDRAAIDAFRVEIQGVLLSTVAPSPAPESTP